MACAAALPDDSGAGSPALPELAIGETGYGAAGISPLPMALIRSRVSASGSVIIG